ncbi:ATP-binding protein [Rhizobium laguerreae]|uniref:ATP-binding protein n=1 Tax=Rhizobium laguerreae TaxID=1076926 RepID=UPI00144271FF|nr:ATP-binding protein [Rhizobium laguerreae]NKN12267.1 AAA family ATPase [Rhizobium laguerreae]
MVNQTMATEELSALRASVRLKFIEGPMDALVADDIKYIVTNIEDFKKGAASPRRGIIAYGPSGTGKTTAIRHAVAKEPEFQPHRNEYGELVPRSIYLKLSSQCSSAIDVIRALLREMNLPTEGTKEELERELKLQVKERQISLIHLDELQHAVRSNTAKAFEAIQDLLKEMLDRDDWHLHMILSGMPRIYNMRADGQIHRRTFVLPFHCMDPEADDVWVEKLLVETAVNFCGLTLDKELLAPEFRVRLCLSMNGAWGKMIEFIQGASFRALAHDRMVLKKIDFAREFERVSGFSDDENMFLAKNFRDIDLSDLRFGMED